MGKGSYVRSKNETPYACMQPREFGNSKSVIETSLKYIIMKVIISIIVVISSWYLSTLSEVLNTWIIVTGIILLIAGALVLLNTLKRNYG